MTPSHQTSLPAVLRARAAETPDRLYVIDVDDRQLTYRQMTEWMDRWAAAWRRAGVEAGEYVVTMQYNTFESLAGWLGLACLGAVETAINTDYRGDLLTHALNITRARTMLVTQQYLERVRDVAAELPHLKRVIVIDADAPITGMPFETVTGTEFLAGVEPLRGESDPAVWDIAAIQFTSGTTGPSKAVRNPWGQQ
jgi:crotonobetaine/carnitine-CoA ligase